MTPVSLGVPARTAGPAQLSNSIIRESGESAYRSGPRLEFHEHGGDIQCPPIPGVSLVGYAHGPFQFPQRGVGQKLANCVRNEIGKKLPNPYTRKYTEKSVLSR